MHPRTQQLLAELESSHAAIEAAIGEIEPSQRDRRTAEGRWTAAEIVEHVAMIDAMLGRLLGSKLAAAKAAGLGRETATSPATLASAAERVKDRSKRLVSPEGGRPTGLEPSAAIASYERAHETIVALVTGMDGLAVGEITHPHPMFGSLDMYQWILFIALHESRHAEQLRELSLDLRSQSNS